MKPGFFFCGASGTPLLRRDRLGCPWTRMKNLASILRPRVWRRRDLWDSQEKCGSLIMGRVTSCPGKRECDEFFDSDNVLCLCRAADTWRVMRSSPPWTTVAKLSENKSVARGKNKLCPPENASLWPVFWRAQSCLEGIHYTYRDRKKQKKWPHCDWKREMMGLVERFYLAIKQFYEMGLLEFHLRNTEQASCLRWLRAPLFLRFITLLSGFNELHHTGSLTEGGINTETLKKDQNGKSQKTILGRTGMHDMDFF